jgi:hypothetical protein
LLLRHEMLANVSDRSDSPVANLLTTSAYPSISTKQRTLRIGSFVPIGDIALRFQYKVTAN